MAEKKKSIKKRILKLLIAVVAVLSALAVGLQIYKR